ncbi:Os11g0617800, partial [Oryza sativa Japonica Group]
PAGGGDGGEAEGEEGSRSSSGHHSRRTCPCSGQRGSPRRGFFSGGHLPSGAALARSADGAEAARRGAAQLGRITDDRRGCHSGAANQSEPEGVTDPSKDQEPQDFEQEVGDEASENPYAYYQEGDEDDGAQ